VAKIQGTITAITDDGDLITSITPAQLADAPRDERTSISCGGHQTMGLFSPDHHEPEMTFLAIVDENALRLSIVGDSARIMLGLRTGEAVVVEWT
jgi:hypothetical protein